MNIKIDDINISYIKEGSSNEKLLLLHGWGSNKEVFNNMIKYLKDDIEVYAIDLPGFGKTNEPSSAFSIDDYTDIVIKFINEMKLDNLSILGHSFGGRIMIKLANRKKLDFKINKYILVDAAGIKHTNLKNRKKVKRNKRLFKIANLFSKRLVNYLKTKIGSEDYKNATPMMRDILVKSISEDLKPLIENINYPTLLVWGEKDTATPYEDALYMKSVIKDSGIVLVPNGGHYSFLDNPSLVNKVIYKFLKGDKK